MCLQSSIDTELKPTTWVKPNRRSTSVTCASISHVMCSPEINTRLMLTSETNCKNPMLTKLQFENQKRFYVVKTRKYVRRLSKHIVTIVQSLQIQYCTEDTKLHCMLVETTSLNNCSFISCRLSDKCDNIFKNVNSVLHLFTTVCCAIRSE